jgi:dihydrofolate synthase / folylpolyglutamate synthase
MGIASKVMTPDPASADSSSREAYRSAIEFLYSLRWFGAKFGLENTLKLAALAGNPHDKLRFIHVAGTNGKGSTCAMLESIYRAAGLRVGLFTSPHLVSFRERIQVNRRPVSENEVVRLVAQMRSLLSGFPAEHHPTFFEVVTVMALRYFAEQECDLVIWETGLGGRLDATNIVTPLAGIITNVQFDHQQWLGDTLEKIAAEKSGIIKPNVPVFTAADEPEALSVIVKTAKEKKAPLMRVTAHHASRIPRLASLPLSGRHQRLNAALALAAVKALQGKLPAGEAAIRTGLDSVHWPGRLQLITRPSGRKVLLDGAHNAAGARSLAAALNEFFPSRRLTLVLGILGDKDWQAICKILAPLAARIFTVPVGSERTALPAALAEVCRTANPKIQATSCASLKEAFSESARDDFILVAGSLYLVGEATELLGLSSSAAGNERGLNEWGGAVSRSSASGRN